MIGPGSDKNNRSIKANGRKIARSSLLLFTFLTWMRGWRCKVLPPSLFVGLSSADRDALGEDYMAKISWERAENPWRDKLLYCTETFSRNCSILCFVSIWCFNSFNPFFGPLSAFLAVQVLNSDLITHRWVRMPQNTYSAFFWKLFKKPFQYVFVFPLMQLQRLSWVTRILEGHPQRLAVQ